MKKLFYVLLTTILIFSCEDSNSENNDDDNNSNTSELTTFGSIVFSKSMDKFKVSFKDDKITGGYGEGTYNWTVVGGVKSGDKLMTVFKTSETTSNNFMCHLFQYNDESVTLLSSVLKNGTANSNINTTYQIDETIKEEISRNLTGSNSISYSQNNDKYKIEYNSNGEVTGGYGSGTYNWSVYGGAIDNSSLIVVFKTTEISSNNILCHLYNINSTSLSLVSSLSISGSVSTNINTTYQKD